MQSTVNYVFSPYLALFNVTKYLISVKKNSILSIISVFHFQYQPFIFNLCKGAPHGCHAMLHHLQITTKQRSLFGIKTDLFHQFIGKIISDGKYVKMRARKLLHILNIFNNIYGYFYSFDTRKSPIENGTHWFDQNLLNGRGRFDARARPAIFALDAIRITDTGLYRCRVDFQKSPTRNSKVNLTVISKCYFFF